MTFIKKHYYSLAIIGAGLISLVYTLATKGPKETIRSLIILIIGLGYLAYDIWKESLKRVENQSSPQPCPQNTIDLEAFNQIVQENKKIFAKNETLYGQIIIIQNQKPALQDSKFGGMPYWPKGKPHPMTVDNQRLSMLAQINCKDVPSSLKWPEKGIIQFFINSNDNLMGCNFDNQADQDGFRVIYHEDTSLESENYPFVEGDENYLPMDVTQPLKIEIREGKMLPLLYSIEMSADLQDIIGSHEEEYIQYCDLMRKKNFGDVVAHQIDGFAYLFQGDPRNESEIKTTFATLLLQMDSDPNHHIMWGDMGISQFFTAKSRLQKGDFSKVMYNWDCC